MQDQFLSRVLPRGFDLVGPFSVSSYNPLVPPEFQLPDFGRQNALGFVFGCSKQLWLPFLHDLSQHPEKLSLNHPLDSYTEGVISEALVKEVLQASRGADDAHVDFQIRYSFSIGKDANKVAIQRLAHVARVAYLNEACHMNIHPTFGPFISLRAAVVLDLECPADLLQRPELTDPFPELMGPLQEKMKGIMDSGRKSEETGFWVLNKESLIELRDLAHSKCSPDSRYSADQIKYHYFKDKELLASLVGKCQK